MMLLKLKLILNGKIYYGSLNVYNGKLGKNKIGVEKVVGLTVFFLGIQIIPREEVEVEFYDIVKAKTYFEW